jgi:hypothetical protein
MSKQLWADGWPVFDVYLPEWALPIRIRAQNGPEAAQLAQILFMIPSNKLITWGPTIDDTAPEASARKKGRPAKVIDLKALSDTLRTTKSPKATAQKLSISRAYIYAALGAEKVRELTA